MKPPVARKVPYVHEIHGDRREDPYFWLREKDSPEVLDHLEAENAYTDAKMAHTKEFQERLFEEIKGRIDQNDDTVPQVAPDGWWYFSRTVEELQYPIILRKKSREASEEEVVLDLNELGAEHDFVSVGDWEVINDTEVWYTVDLTGFRQYQLRVRDIISGVDEEVHGPDTLNRVTGFEFVEGRSDMMWFAVEDEMTKRSHQVYFWKFGQAPVLAFEEKDERFSVDLSKSSDRSTIIVTTGSLTTTCVYYVDSDNFLNLLVERKDGVEVYADRQDGVWYFMTNDKGKNFRIITGDNEELLSHDPEAMIEATRLFSGHLVAKTRKEGITSLLVAPFVPGAIKPSEPNGSGVLPWERIEFPEDVIECGFGVNWLNDEKSVRVWYTSLSTPLVEYDCDLETLELTELKRTKVLGSYNPDDYVGTRIYATAQDGTSIPVTVCHRKDTPLDGSAPMHLVGYGAYGIPCPIGFSYGRLSLLDRGFVYALAHVRGGGERGKAWHDEGRMEKKMNTFTDFIACAEHLVREKYTSPDRLCIEGGSAGGLLIGVVVNMRPDLFGCVMSNVPFVDALTTMLDETIPLTVGEYEEWGNPNDPAAYERMRAYCPITNIKAQNYPPMLVRTSYNDSQVMYWEPAKYVAKLRDTKTDSNDLLFKCLMDAGHGGPSGRYDAYRDAAFDFAFIFDQFGITE